MTVILLLAVLIGAAWIARIHARLAQTEDRLRDVEVELASILTWRDHAPSPSDDRTPTTAEPRETAAAVKAVVVEGAVEALTAAEAPAAPAVPAPAIWHDLPEVADEADHVPPRERPSFETLVGGRLPIWVGGVALVLAGIFLVRYSIESGLLGPGVRTLLAALFATLLIAGSEAARRAPATAGDPRIGQVLAGAGIASAYATLYLAAALYHLIAPLPAFALMLAVTGGGLALAFRHGPPTAVMALIGGFAAPLVAGFDTAGIGPLLVYLGLFAGALFGLAVQRSWAWLGFATTAAAFAWINLLLFSLSGEAVLSGEAMAAIGAFAVLLAGAASAVLPATGVRSPWVRAVPMVAGLVQLLVIASALHFDALAWGFYLTLSGAALLLAWRDASLTAGALASALLVLVLLAVALLQPGHAASPIAAIVATLIFALPGHALSRRGRAWAATAIIGTAGPVLVAHAAQPALLPGFGWAAIELLAAGAGAALSWRHRDRIDAGDIGLVGGAIAAACLGVIGLGQLLGTPWLGLILALAMLGLGVWARQVDDAGLRSLPALPFLAAIVASSASPLTFIATIAEALAGKHSLYHLLPGARLVLRDLAPPVLAVAALMRLDDAGVARTRRVVSRLAAGLAAALALLILYTLAKQPLRIDSEARFVEWGFAERALITQACLAAGWLLARSRRADPLGPALIALGLFRFVLFDLLLLNPAIVRQWVGPLPILNLATLSAALAAFWFWRLIEIPRNRVIAMLLTIVAVTATVRQAAHGAYMVGPVGEGESWGYSAAFLLLAITWLWRGIGARRIDLRAAGLALMTLVSLKVFLVDAAAFSDLLRVVSLIGLGLTLIGISWAYNRFLARPVEADAPAGESA